MADEVVTSTPVAPPVIPPVAPQVPAAVSGEDWKNMNAEQFRARMDQAEGKGVKGILKETGMSSLEDVKAALLELKKLQDAKLSDQERVAKQLAELTPQAEKAKAYGETIGKYLAALESEVAEDKKALLELAPTDPSARLEWIIAARGKGLFAAPAAAPAAPKPATTMAAGGPAPTAPAGQISAYDRFEQLHKIDPVLGATFMQSNQTAINASRPK